MNIIIITFIIKTVPGIFISVFIETQNACNQSQSVFKATRIRTLSSNKICRAKLENIYTKSLKQWNGRTDNYVFMLQKTQHVG